jgi:hypothetical protein
MVLGGVMENNKSEFADLARLRSGSLRSGTLRATGLFAMALSTAFMLMLTGFALAMIIGLP